PVGGAVLPGSPAQKAGIAVGDRVVSFDGKPQRDFTKIHLNVALIKEGQAVPIVVQKPDGSERTLSITAARSESDNGAFLQLGILPSPELRAPKHDKQALKEIEDSKGLVPDETYCLRPGEAIIAVN